MSRPEGHSWASSAPKRTAEARPRAWKARAPARRWGRPTPSQMQPLVAELLLVLLLVRLLARRRRPCRTEQEKGVDKHGELERPKRWTAT